MTKENNLSILVSKLPILYRSSINYIVYLRQPSKVKLHTGGMPTRKWFVSFLDLWWGSSARHIVVWTINWSGCYTSKTACIKIRSRKSKPIFQCICYYCCECYSSQKTKDWMMDISLWLSPEKICEDKHQGYYQWKNLLTPSSQMMQISQST